MRDIRQMWKDLDYSEKRQWIEGGIAWVGLIWLVFILSVIGR